MALSGKYAMSEQAQDGALYFDPDDVSEISQAITSLWDDVKIHTKLRENLKRVAKKHSLKAFSANLLNIITACRLNVNG